MGGLVVVATATSVHLYISRKELESKYRSLVIEKEERFARMSRFENQSPLVRTELEGSIWQVEMLAMDSAKSKETLTDRIFFVDGRVHSEELLKKGFQPTNYTVTPSLNGMTSWETVQTNDRGDTVSWRGDWQGDAMKGIVHFAPASGPARDFSFYSLNWAYAEMEAS